MDKCSLEDRNATFINTAQPSNSTPTEETYGSGAKPLSIGLSSKLNDIDKKEITFDVDGLFGHVHIGELSRTITSSSFHLVKSNKIEYLEKSKYCFNWNGISKKIASLQSLQIGELSTLKFKKLNLYLVWAEHQDIEVILLSSIHCLIIFNRT